MVKRSWFVPIRYASDVCSEARPLCRSATRRWIVGHAKATCNRSVSEY